MKGYSFQLHYATDRAHNELLGLFCVFLAEHQSTISNLIQKTMEISNLIQKTMEISNLIQKTMEI